MPNSNDQNGFVYTLSDPRTGDVKYVGATKEPQQRLRNHHSASPNQELEAWKQELREEGLRPEMTLVAISPLEELAEKEQSIIRRLSDEWELLNKPGAPMYSHATATIEEESQTHELSERELGKVENAIDIMQQFADRGELDRAATVARHTKKEVLNDAG